MDKWPFVDLPSTVAVTSSDITNCDNPILYVSHEIDEDGDVTWQFHYDENNFDFSRALLVRLDTILSPDLTIASVSSLPIGYSAKRCQIGGDWTIRPV